MIENTPNPKEFPGRIKSEMSKMFDPLKAKAGEVKAKSQEWTQRGKEWLKQQWGKVKDKPKDVIEAVSELPEHKAELIVEPKTPETKTVGPEDSGVIGVDIKKSAVVKVVKTEIPHLPEESLGIVQEKPPLIQKWLRQAEEAFNYSKYSKPLKIDRRDREHTRPFYKDSRRGYYIEDVGSGLPAFAGRTCDQWIAALAEQQPIAVLDICCGTGSAALQLEKAHPNVTAYGVTGSTFYYEDGEIKKDAMQLPTDKLALGNVACIRDVLEQKWQGKHFDVIYSYKGLPYIPLPFLHHIKEIYPLLKEGGVAFLHDPPADYNEVSGVDQLKKWLDEKGYKFEFVTDEEKKHITKCSFQKTHDMLNLPIDYSDGYKSSFKNQQ